MATVLPKRDVIRALRRKLRCTARNAHHIYYDFVVDDMIVGSPYVSHGSGGGDLDDFLLGMMAEELGVSKRTFVDMVRCTKNRDDIIAELRESGAL